MTLRKHTILRCLALAGTAVLFSSCVTVPLGPVRGAAKSEKDVVYTPPSWPKPVKADIYLPKGDGPAPAVLLLHGGGFRDGGSRWQMNAIAGQLVKRGYVVMNATYRGIPQDQFPAPLDDVREALRWMKTNAARYRIDPDRIATFGYSAGGNLASLVALYNKPGNPTVKAIVAGGTPFDFTLYPGGDLIPTYLGGTQQEIPDRFREASPLYHVTRKSPPLFIYHGTKDPLVRPEHVLHMDDAYTRAGAEIEIHWLHDHGHVGAFVFSGPVVEQAIDFLDKKLK